MGPAINSFQAQVAWRDAHSRSGLSVAGVRWRLKAANGQRTAAADLGPFHKLMERQMTLTFKVNAEGRFPNKFSPGLVLGWLVEAGDTEIRYTLYSNGRVLRSNPGADKSRVR
jgi:hypothetical protein